MAWSQKQKLKHFYEIWKQGEASKEASKQKLMKSSLLMKAELLDSKGNPADIVGKKDPVEYKGVKIVYIFNVTHPYAPVGSSVWQAPSGKYYYVPSESGKKSSTKEGGKAWTKQPKEQPKQQAYNGVKVGDQYTKDGKQYEVISITGEYPYETVNVGFPGTATAHTASNPESVAGYIKQSQESQNTTHIPAVQPQVGGFAYDKNGKQYSITEVYHPSSTTTEIKLGHPGSTVGGNWYNLSDLQGTPFNGPYTFEPPPTKGEAPTSKQPSHGFVVGGTMTKPGNTVVYEITQVNDQPPFSKDDPQITVKSPSGSTYTNVASHYTKGLGYTPNPPQSQSEQQLVDPDYDYKVGSIVFGPNTGKEYTITKISGDGTHIWLKDNVTGQAYGGQGFSNLQKDGWKVKQSEQQPSEVPQSLSANPDYDYQVGHVIKNPEGESATVTKIEGEGPNAQVFWKDGKNDAIEGHTKASTLQGMGYVIQKETQTSEPLATSSEPPQPAPDHPYVLNQTISSGVGKKFTVSQITGTGPDTKIQLTDTNTGKILGTMYTPKELMDWGYKSEGSVPPQQTPQPAATPEHQSIAPSQQPAPTAPSSPPKPKPIVSPGEIQVGSTLYAGAKPGWVVTAINGSGPGAILSLKDSSSNKPFGGIPTSIKSFMDAGWSFTPPEQHEAAPSAPQTSHTMPASLHDFSAPLKHLGGSTGADLVEDTTTHAKYVKKKGASPEHAANEVAANRVYRLLGVPAPRTKLYTDGDATKSVLIHEYVEGTPLSKVLASGDTTLIAKVKLNLRKYFAVHALLGNWDVHGKDDDNIIVDHEGTPHFIDNGGAFDFKAMGEKKPNGSYGSEVKELKTMLDQHQTHGANYYQGLTQTEIGQQIKDLEDHELAILQIVPKHLRKTVLARLNYLRGYAGMNEISFLQKAVA